MLVVENNLPANAVIYLFILDGNFIVAQCININSPIWWVFPGTTFVVVF